MPVVVVGLNHQVAPVEVRERIAFAPHQMEVAHQALRERVQEGVILSICNRVEVYAVVDRAAAGVHSIGSFFGRLHDSAIVNELLHQPVAQLKAESSGGNGSEYVQALRRPFALELEG